MASASKDPNRKDGGPLFSGEHEEGLLADKPVSLNCEEVSQSGSHQREEKNDPTGVCHAAGIIAAGNIRQDADSGPGHRHEKGLRSWDILEFERKFFPPCRHEKLDPV